MLGEYFTGFIWKSRRNGDYEGSERRGHEAESGIGGDIDGKCTDDCACMDCGVCLLESHEKDTA